MEKYREGGSKQNVRSCTGSVERMPREELGDYIRDGSPLVCSDDK